MTFETGLLSTVLFLEITLEGPVLKIRCTSKQWAFLDLKLIDLS